MFPGDSELEPTYHPRRALWRRVLEFSGKLTKGTKQEETLGQRFPISFLESSSQICLSLSCFLIILKGLRTPAILTEKICIFHSIWLHYHSSSSLHPKMSSAMKLKKKKDSLETKSSSEERVRRMGCLGGLWAGVPISLQFYILRAKVSAGTSSNVLGKQPVAQTPMPPPN